MLEVLTPTPPWCSELRIKPVLSVARQCNYIVTWCTVAQNTFSHKLTLKEASVLSVTTPARWLIPPSEFEPSDPATFGKSKRVARLNYFLPIQVSRALNWKLASSVCNAEKISAGSLTLLHAPLSSFQRNERGWRAVSSECRSMLWTTYWANWVNSLTTASLQLAATLAKLLPMLVSSVNLTVTCSHILPL